MPLYEYECDSCGHRFEVIQKFSDAPLTEHDKCGGPVERLLSAPALQFKGTGWYVTDYGRGNSGPAKPESKTEPAKKAEPAKSDSGSSTPAKSDPK